MKLKKYIAQFWDLLHQLKKKSVVWLIRSQAKQNLERRIWTLAAVSAGAGFSTRFNCTWSVKVRYFVKQYTKSVWKNPNYARTKKHIKAGCGAFESWNH